MYSKLHYNGQVFMVDIFKWADLTLNQADHSEFTNDMMQEQSYLLEAESNGKVLYDYFEPIVNENNEQIGHYFYIAKKPDGTPDITPDHPSRTKWQARFAADPDVEYWGKIWEIVS